MGQSVCSSCPVVSLAANALLVLIAYTNHALDHLLSDVLEAGITDKLVRLGSQSSDERVSEYTLEKLDRAQEDAGWKKIFDPQFRAMKELEEKLINVIRLMSCGRPSWSQIQAYLTTRHRKQVAAFNEPAAWIQVFIERLKKDEEENGKWSSKSRKRSRRAGPKTTYDIWKEGLDIDFLSSAKAPVSTDTFVADMLAALGPIIQYFPPASSDRSLDVLLHVTNVWDMSHTERAKIAAHWEDGVRSYLYASNLSKYKSQRSRYKDACKALNVLKDEVGRDPLVIIYIYYV